MHDQLMLPYGRTTGMLVVSINKSKQDFLVFLRNTYQSFRGYFTSSFLNQKVQSG